MFKEYDVRPQDIVSFTKLDHVFYDTTASSRTSQSDTPDARVRADVHSEADAHHDDQARVDAIAAAGADERLLDGLSLRNADPPAE